MSTAQHRAAPAAPAPTPRDDRAPHIVARIERRLLVNYRVDPAVAASLLPTGRDGRGTPALRPQLVDGSAVAGVCLLRMGGLRPTWSPPGITWGAENAAHRIAVEWDGTDDDGTPRVQHGVYIPGRHSASWVPVALGGRVMPGVHRHARFDVEEWDDRYRVSFSAPGVEVDVDVETTTPAEWRSSLFPTVDDASAFFRAGAIGWSPKHGGPGADGTRLEGLELRTDAWSVRPGRMHRLRSTFFDALPRGSAEFDDVLVMRNVPVTWGTPRYDDVVRTD